MRVVYAQIDSSLNRDNLAKHIDIINKASGDLIVFPELSLSGYMLQDKLFENAYIINELQEIIELSYDIDIILGVALREKNAIYNASLYLSQNRILHIHKKVYLPNYGMFEEARFFTKGENINTFKTKFGIFAMIICEDLWRAETINILSQINPDFISVISNSPARDFKDGGLEIEDQWNALLKSCALLSKSSVLFVNRVGFEDGLGFWGASKVITPQGKIKHRLAYFEENIKSFILDPQISTTQKIIFKHD
jgi:predicted amidohydrolase